MGVIASHVACARMEEGHVSNYLNYLFPDVKSRGDAKLTVKNPPWPFSVTNGIIAETSFQGR